MQRAQRLARDFLSVPLGVQAVKVIYKHLLGLDLLSPPFQASL
jgi:hypothetical protein